ncbi:1,6-anhydro-N-acetylmuramyl-L-alanine amidase AmpD [Kineobactrum sediminis]|uniref:1,6-anhydro-N-acetylmuramyl-L-alanine amidase AmpD n=1 Tax=Kineobactrum sediminis TaxID=1905677 RepID=A0A2N5Y3J1_9GAMM|nr:1,6-anhydro-N-acetylmuramyl-L-alanine amidase AmpD [Kineobactrum sediminis]PLW82961.1 1,6-anhydro-N-acetylmuramyl-L-alanine amidase AmpD [Kineobactrum sediminis]
MGYTISKGWLQGARRVPSPNFGARPSGVGPELIVIHSISLPPGCFGGPEVEQLFTNCLDWDADPWFAQIRGLEVSAHFLVRRCGELVQFVSVDDRAWHAGVSRWQGRDNCNDFSIGIELEGCDEFPYSDAQYESLAALSRTLLGYYPLLGPERVAGHCDIAPGRKTDPGPTFDWPRYRAGLVLPGDTG